MRALPGGGYVLNSDQPMVPLRPEYGGDGRTLEDTLREAKDPVYRASLKLAQIAEKHKARLEALGFEIVVGDPAEPKPAAEPKPVKGGRGGDNRCAVVGDGGRFARNPTLSSEHGG